MTQIQEAAAVAAKWWADQLRGGIPRQQVGDATADVMLTLLAAQRPALSEEKIAAFEECLRRDIQGELERLAAKGSRGMTVSTDYGPEDVLAQAAEQTGARGAAFPAKTIMWVSPEEVTVALGYGAKGVRLWPQEPGEKE